MTSQPTVHLIDASIYIFRAWFSVPDSMLGENGQPINAAYGFCRFLTEFLEKSSASHVGIAFDESLTQSFRNDIYPEYKMNRELAPEELAKQFSLCKRIAEASGLYCIGHERYEADDLIASMALVMREAGFRNVIVSGDKDLAQIIRGEDLWWDFARNEQRSCAAIQEKFGVPPESIQDYLGLCGDAVDNIPGVPGIGPKTASALLQRYSTVEGVYDNLDMIRHLQIRGAKTLGAKLKDFEEQALLSKRLATVAYDAPVPQSIDVLKRRSAEVSSLREISQILGGRGTGLFERISDSSKGLQS